MKSYNLKGVFETRRQIKNIKKNSLNNPKNNFFLFLVRKKMSFFPVFILEDLDRALYRHFLNSVRN